MDFAPMNLNWDNSKSHIFINPAYSKDQSDLFRKVLDNAGEKWPAHFWFSTSGSSALKWVGLSKKALLASAASVNTHLESNKDDIWVNPLPIFHVGGLSIEARSFLSGAKVCDYRKAYPGKWSSAEFYDYLLMAKGTLTSLVPAQLHDLIELKKSSPSSLRGVIIGGGALHPVLYERGVELGWPLLPSYGLTECASQVATASLNSWKGQNYPSLKMLPHLEGKIEEGRFWFSGFSLLSAYAHIEGKTITFSDPKVEGWLKTEDRGAIQKNRTIEVWGRVDAVCKIGGENVDLSRLEGILQTLCYKLSFPGEATLLAVSDSRLGHMIQLAVSSPNNNKVESLVQEFQKSVLPFEKIRKIHFLKELPRSPLGKILKQELIQLIFNKDAQLEEASHDKSIRQS
jgi:o-succinylbenzoate---CoA ligase